MNLFKLYILTLLVAMLISISLYGQPSFGNSIMIRDQKIFPDSKKKNVFYYIPFDYKLVTDAFGKPSFTLLKMRYTGTSATADAGVMKYNNLLQFKVAVDPQRQKLLNELKTEFHRTYPYALLQELPIQKFSSLLVYASSGSQLPDDSLHLIKTSLTEAIDENAAVNKTYWTERTITIRLNNTDAQLIENALVNAQTTMSFSYAFYSVFADRPDLSTTITGNNQIIQPVRNYFENEIKNSIDSAKHVTLVKADAIPVYVDVSKWPEIIKKIDINDRFPAKYPLFDIYCYDFNQDLRADLFEKKIDIMATHVNGTDIITSYSFNVGRPEVYAKSIRFVYAIRFDKPFYYRVTEINQDGDKKTGDWIQKTNWSELLDITSSPEQIILKPKPVDGNEK